MHQTLVVADVMGEDGQHHGVLRRRGKSAGGVNMGGDEEIEERGEMQLIEGPEREKSISQSLFIKCYSATER